MARYNLVFGLRAESTGHSIAAARIRRELLAGARLFIWPLGDVHV
jgi:hypothetical protein